MRQEAATSTSTTISATADTASKSATTTAKTAASAPKSTSASSISATKTDPKTKLTYFVNKSKYAYFGKGACVIGYAGTAKTVVAPKKFGRYYIVPINIPYSKKTF